MSQKQIAGHSALIALLLTIFIDAVGLGVVYPVFTSAILENSLSMSQALMTFGAKNTLFNCLLMVFPFAMFLGAPVMGALSDKYGRKLILCISLIGNIIGFSICAIAFLSTSVTEMLFLLFLGRIISGLSAGCVPIAQAAIADISLGNEKASKLGLISVANGVGFTLGPIIGSIFLSDQIKDMGLSLPMIILSALSLIALLSIFFFFENTGAAKDPNAKINIFSGLTNIYLAFKVKTSRLLIMAFACYIIGYLGFFQYWSILLTKKLGYSSQMIGYTISYYAIFFSIALIFLLPIFMKKMKLPTIMIASLALQLICLTAFFFIAKLSLLIWALLIPMAIAFSFCYVASVSLVSNATDKSDQGKIMGVLGSLTALGWIFGPLIALFADTIQINAPVYVYMALIFVAFFFAIKSATHQAASSNGQ